MKRGYYIVAISIKNSSIKNPKREKLLARQIIIIF